MRVMHRDKVVVSTGCSCSDALQESVRYDIRNIYTRLCSMVIPKDDRAAAAVIMISCPLRFDIRDFYLMGEDNHNNNNCVRYALVIGAETDSFNGDATHCRAESRFFFFYTTCYNWDRRRRRRRQSRLFYTNNAMSSHGGK